MGLLRTLLASVAKRRNPAEFLNCTVATLHVRRDEIGLPFVTRTRGIQRLSPVICDRPKWGSGIKLHSSNSEPSMSALGQERTFSRRALMSALAPKAESLERVDTSALCHKQTLRNRQCFANPRSRAGARAALLQCLDALPRNNKHVVAPLGRRPASGACSSVTSKDKVSTWGWLRFGTVSASVFRATART